MFWSRSTRNNPPRPERLFVPRVETLENGPLMPGGTLEWRQNSGVAQNRRGNLSHSPWHCCYRPLHTTSAPCTVRAGFVNNTSDSRAPGPADVPVRHGTGPRHPHDKHLLLEINVRYFRGNFGLQKSQVSPGSPVRPGGRERVVGFECGLLRLPGRTPVCLHPVCPCSHTQRSDRYTGGREGKKRPGPPSLIPACPEVGTRSSTVVALLRGQDPDSVENGTGNHPKQEPKRTTPPDPVEDL